MCGPRHIATAGITLHLTPKQPDIFKVLNRHGFVTKKIHEEESVRCIVIPQHPTSEWHPRYVLAPPQPFFVFRCDVNHVLHHYFVGIKHTTNTTLFCSGTHLEDKADCIVGVYSYWMYNSNWIVCANCHWVFTALNCGYIIRHTLWVFPETTTTATLALVCERMESVFCTVAENLSFSTIILTFLKTSRDG